MDYTIVAEEKETITVQMSRDTWQNFSEKRNSSLETDDDYDENGPVILYPVSDDDVSDEHKKLIEDVRKLWKNHPSSFTNI